tara:strand:- start:62 stop:598 length:537 start_codon:yes stop_codon:yes gene_type:complete
MIDIYPEDATIYNPLLDSLVENVMTGGERPEFLNLVRQIESGGRYRPFLGKTDFPFGNPKARAETTTAAGVYQFTEGAVDAAKNRAINLGFDSGFINLIPNDPTQWTNKEADTMLLANLFAQIKKDEQGKPIPGFVDELLEKVFQGDRKAMQEAYYSLHHTAPDDATRRRVEQIMPLK